MTQMVYSNLLDELASGEITDLQRKIYALLKDAPEGLSRGELVYLIYGYTPVRLEASADDRKIRKAIEKLRQRLFPIVSTSGRPGYRLDASPESVRQMLAELKSRRDHIQEQINAAAKFYQVSEYIEPVTATQASLL